MLWKFVENCGFPVVEGPTPSSWGSQLEQTSTTELYRSERWARPTTQPTARGSSPAHRILVITCSRTMVLRVPHSQIISNRTRMQNRLIKKLWINFLITGDRSNFFIHIVIHFTAHKGLLGGHLRFGGKWNSLRLQCATGKYPPA